jgi:hypothetical protein
MDLRGRGVDPRSLEGRRDDVVSTQLHFQPWVHPDLYCSLGLAIDDFPNLFFTYGPHGPTAFCNGPTCLQLQGAWIVQVITYLRDHITKLTPTTHAALTFKKHIDELCNGTLLAQVDSWYMGANIPGKKREAYNYAGGAVVMAEIERGYPGFLREELKPYH